MKEFNVEATKFHGETYIESEDKKRLTGQVQRIWDILCDGQEHTSVEISEKAAVPLGGMSKRLGDMRVYHKMIIESTRIKGGLWKYKFIRYMTPEEHASYMYDLRAHKPIGNEELWGKMWQSIHAYSSAADMINLAKMQEATSAWARDMAHKLWTEKKNV